MGHFQAYKFLAVDQPLSSAARKEVAALSSRSKVSSTSASFVYHYGDFKGDPEMVLIEHFDLYMYFSNFGERYLTLKFPKNTVDHWAIKDYEIDIWGHGIIIKNMSYCLLIQLEWNDEDGGGGWLEEDDYDLADFIRIREAIIDGDYSALFLFWLKIASNKTDFDEEEYDDDIYEDEEDDLEEGDIKTPPIPPKLAKSKHLLDAFINYLEIDKDLANAAILAAKSLKVKPQTINYENLLEQLSEVEKDMFLMQLLDGEPRVDLQLKKHLEKQVQKNKSLSNTTTLQTIFNLQHQAQAERKAEERQIAEQQHKAKMEKLAREESIVWNSVYFNLNRKSGNSYQLATDMLVDLKALAIYQNKLASFQEQMTEIKEKYGRSRALLNRLSNAGL